MYVFASANVHLTQSVEIEKRCFDLNQTGVKLECHAQSWPECFVDRLSRYLPLP
jgi:hypothetical protein